MRVAAVTLVAVAAMAGAACGGDSNDPNAAQLAVTGTDDGCVVASTDVAAGKTTFVFTNRSKQVNEIYVKTSSGKIVKEVEDVITGQTKRFTVTLQSGSTYTVQCKPGQKGDGFTTDITVK